MRLGRLMRGSFGVVVCVLAAAFVACLPPGPDAAGGAGATTADAKLAADIQPAANLPGVMIQPAVRNPDQSIKPFDGKSWTFLPRNADGSSKGI
jgi:hypothetical protein